VAALHEALDAKLGRPVLAVLREHTERQRQRASASLEGRLYIPIEGVAADERGKFEAGPGNPPFDLLHDNERGLRHFLGVLSADAAPDDAAEAEPVAAAAVAGAARGGDDADEIDDGAATATDPPSTLILAGAAGSGKSTFLEKLEAFLRDEYAAHRAAERPGVVLVLLVVQLGGLQNPLTDLWNEGLRRQYRLTPSQCDELRTRVHDGEAEVLFLLDAHGGRSKVAPALADDSAP